MTGPVTGLTARLPVRARLTLAVAASLVLVAAAVMAVGYVVLARSIETQPFGLVRPDAAQEELERARIEAGAVPGADDEARQARLKEQAIAADDQLRAELRRELPRQFAATGGAVLAVVALGGGLLGWWWSGRAMAPVGRIVADARRIAGRDLHERIATTGPHDQVHELAGAFNDLLARLEQAVDTQWRFIANASHELRTPLAINRTVLEVAMERPGAHPSLVQLGDTLLAVNSRHEHLVEGLLTLARSEHRVIAPVPVDLSEMLRRMVDVAGPEASRADVTITVEDRPAWVAGDPTLLERLVLNLLQNAIRHNTRGGWVRVSTSGGAPAARLAVSNSGRRVPKYATQKLFEPFHRLEGRVSSGRGSGLGLSIVRSVARAHGGDAVARARPEGGLDVEITIPALAG